MNPISDIVRQSVPNALKFTRAGNFAKWYKEVINVAGLASKSSVPGCMIIFPLGMTIWERVQDELNRSFKRRNCCENYYFPLFIPVSLFEREATHVDGFAQECVVATHDRMKMVDGKMVPDPAAKLPEPYVIRPTSEMIIGEFFRDKIRETNKLPLQVNQWCNVVRAEHHTRLFLRTMEFLWQEGHCAFSNEKDARTNALKMAQVYQAFVTNICAVPVIMGEKSEEERFAGADQTFCLEAMMQDGKAVQAATSHYLGQNFSKASEIFYKNPKGDLENVYTTSWGLSTRLIGCLIMVHADDNGMRVPPRLAQHHVVVIPSGKECVQRSQYIERIQNVFLENEPRYENQEIAYWLDNSNDNAGSKKWDAIRKGVPLIFEVGPREAKQENVTVYRRDQDPAKKTTVSIDALIPYVISTLGEIQINYYTQAENFLKANIRTDITDFETLKAFFAEPSNRGFVRAKWSGDRVAEKALKKEHGVTIRCLPFDQDDKEGICVLTGKPATREAIFAKSY